MPAWIFSVIPWTAARDRNSDAIALPANADSTVRHSHLPITPDAALSGKASAGIQTAVVEGAWSWHERRGLNRPVQQVSGRRVPPVSCFGAVCPAAANGELEEVMPSAVQPLHAIRVVDRQYVVKSGQREVELWVRRQ